MLKRMRANRSLPIGWKFQSLSHQRIKPSFTRGSLRQAKGREIGNQMEDPWLWVPAESERGQRSAVASVSVIHNHNHCTILPAFLASSAYCPIVFVAVKSLCWPHRNPGGFGGLLTLKPDQVIRGKALGLRRLTLCNLKTGSHRNIDDSNEDLFRQRLPQNPPRTTLSGWAASGSIRQQPASLESGLCRRGPGAAEPAAKRSRRRIEDSPRGHL